MVRDRLNTDEDFRSECDVIARANYGRPFGSLDPALAMEIARNLNTDEWRRLAWLNDTNKDVLKNTGGEVRMPNHAVIAEDARHHHQRTYYEDATTIERRVDLKRAFDRLIKKYGRTICDAAAGEITANEAVRRLLGRRRADILRDIEQANEEAKALLRDYSDALPRNVRAIEAKRLPSGSLAPVKYHARRNVGGRVPFSGSHSLSMG